MSNRRLPFGIPEYNYLFLPYRTYEEARDFIPVVTVPAAIKNKLNKSREMALLCGWRFHSTRTALTSFTLHWLTKSKEPIEKYAQKLHQSPDFRYFYCTTTFLPVLGVKVDWAWAERWTLRERPVDTRDIFYLQRDSSFQRHLNQWKQAEAEGRINDEYVRCFGGTPIDTDNWLYLKGIVDMYLPLAKPVVELPTEEIEELL